MDIGKIEISDWCFSGSKEMLCDGLCHIKSLPCFSIVQSQVGSYDIKLDNSPVYHTGEGGFFLAPAQVKQTIVHHFSAQRQTMTARWIFLNIVVNGQYRYEDLFTPPILLPEACHARMNALMDMLETQGDLCDRMSTLYQVVKMILMISRYREEPIGEAVLHALQYLRDHFAQPLSVRELAAAANLSESHFYVVFREQLGITPIAYLCQYRLAVASGMLKETREPITAIASATGFSDPFYFSRVFRERFGMSPREYRKLHLSV